jgi:hypothetical protein
VRITSIGGPSPELQRAIDAFPKEVKHKENAAREKKRIMKNFISVRDKVYR